MVEIGPGRGSLTRALAARTSRLIAVEIDAHLARKLSRELAGKTTVVTADFLDFELPEEPYSVVGNIPYGRSTEIVRKLAFAAHPPRDAWLVVQRELAGRMCGLPFQRENPWSLALKPFWHLEILDRPGRTEFDPPPSVESAFLWMAHRVRPILESAEAGRWDALIRVGFGGGGTIAQALRATLTKPQIRRLSGDLRFSPEARPGDLVFEQWLGILRFVQRAGVRLG